MKKLILSATFLAMGAICVMAQGVVKFSIDPAEAWGDSVDRLIYMTQVGVDPVNDPTWSAELQQNVGGSWEALGPKVNFIGDFDGFRGYWFDDGVSRTATSDTLRIAVYDGTDTLLAASPSFAYAQGTSVPPVPKDTLMVNFTAFAVPEPSTIALGVLGLGALLIFRRRK